MSMSMGMNTNIEYQGKVYHVQTEDGGLDRPVITTLLFKDGAVFASKRTDYKELIASPSYQETVTEMMKEQHKTIIKELVGGKIDVGVEYVGELSDLEITSEKLEVNIKAKPVQESKQQSTDQGKSLDDLIVDYLAKKNSRTD